MKKFKKKRGMRSAGIRNEKIFDAPPVDISAQEVPRSLKELMLLKESVRKFDSDKAKGKPHSVKLLSQVTILKGHNVPKSPMLNVSTSSEKLSMIANESHLESDNVVRRQSKLKQKKKLKLVKLREKRKNKKLLAKLENDRDLSEIQKDDIKFGEVVHRPPQLSVLPRKVAQSGFKNRPGRKDDLLLKSLLKRKHSEVKR